MLQILSLNSTDSSSNKYKATRSTGSCNYNILPYSNEKTGLLKIFNQECLLNSTSNQTFDIELKSFKNQINLIYSLESVPLNNLKIMTKYNETILDSQKCDSQSKPWLNCLQSTITMTIPLCSNKSSFSLSYGYDNEEEYFKNNITINKETFYHSLSIKCNFCFIWGEKIFKILNIKIFMRYSSTTN